MTIASPAEPGVLTPEPPAPAPRGRRALPGGRIALSAAVVLTLLSGWYVVARQAASGLTVTYGAVRCSQGHAGTAQVVSGDGDVHRKVPAISVTPGARCVLPVTIRNRGLVAVQLDRATLPQLGPRGALGLRVTKVPHHEVQGAGADAHIRLQGSLAPGDQTSLRIELRYRPGGCTPPRVSIEGLPRLHVHALHLSSQRSPTTVLVLRGTDRSCGR